ncbi:hypothetical protein HRbin21_01163 [bacterium HR21]|nr:hypothetical protein HRbin21_01163 [bacterium HR21]
MLRLYLAVLALVALGAMGMTEGHVRLRIALGMVFVGGQAVVIRRLWQRFRRSSQVLWMLTVVLLTWLWSRWAWELGHGGETAGALLLVAALLATIGLTVFWIRQWWRAQRQQSMGPLSSGSSATEKPPWEPMDR